VPLKSFAQVPSKVDFRSGPKAVVFGNCAKYCRRSSALCVLSSGGVGPS
jgi:hypothetical protein